MLARSLFFEAILIHMKEKLRNVRKPEMFFHLDSLEPISINCLPCRNGCRVKVSSLEAVYDWSIHAIDSVCFRHPIASL